MGDDNLPAKLDELNDLMRKLYKEVCSIKNPLVRASGKALYYAIGRFAKMIVKHGSGE